MTKQPELPGVRPALALIRYQHGMRIVEVIETKGDKSKIREWDGAKREFGFPKWLASSSLMGAPEPGDSRAVAIDAWYAAHR